MSVTHELKIENPATAIAAVKLLLDSASAPRLAMQGTSMLPLLREPMVLELAPIEGSIAIGDIVVFENDGKLVAHRVTALRNGAVQTCGDARPWSPEYPPAQSYVGKVRTVFENDRPGAARVDTKAFRIRGALYARTRSARALPWLVAALTRRIGGALPWRRHRAYPALVEAMAGVVAQESSRFEGALSQVEPSELAATARRHGCSAILLEALSTFRTCGTAAAYLQRALQPLGRNVALLSFMARNQIVFIATTLGRSGVPFALLKGASRLYRNEQGSALHSISDIDILVPADRLDSATEALRAQGYDERNYAPLRDRYRDRHHHAAPLFPPSQGFAVELHTSLAPPGLLSTQLDWEALQPFMAAAQGPVGEVLCFDTVGSALHLAVHSLGLARLRDSVLLACLLATMSDSERERLQRIAAAERIDPVRLNGSLALGARIAGIAWPQSAHVERYLDWASRREDVPLYFSQRSQLIEGFYAAGRRLTPFTWRLLDPRFGIERKSLVASLGRIAGRTAAGICALTYARLMRQTT